MAPPSFWMKGELHPGPGVGGLGYGEPAQPADRRSARGAALAAAVVVAVIMGRAAAWRWRHAQRRDGGAAMMGGVLERLPVQHLAAGGPDLRRGGSRVAPARADAAEAGGAAAGLLAGAAARERLRPAAAPRPRPPSPPSGTRSGSPRARASARCLGPACCAGDQTPARQWSAPQRHHAVAAVSTSRSQAVPPTRLMTW